MPHGIFILVFSVLEVQMALCFCACILVCHVSEALMVLCMCDLSIFIAFNLCLFLHVMSCINMFGYSVHLSHFSLHLICAFFFMLCVSRRAFTCSGYWLLYFRLLFAHLKFRSWCCELQYRWYSCRFEMCYKYSCCDPMDCNVWITSRFKVKIPFNGFFFFLVV